MPTDEFAPDSPSLVSAACIQCGSQHEVARFCPACGAEQPEGGARASTDPLIGHTLAARYRITGLIKAGGMGRVYRGTQLLLDRTVAIKVVHPELLSTEQVVERFMQEARALSRLNHPNIVSIYDFGRDDTSVKPQLFIVMELLGGVELESLVQKGPLPISQAADIAKQVLSGLAEAHDQGTTHRDLKPENVMLETVRGGGVQVKLIDFGIAKGEGPRKITKSGQIIGTPYYMAPEQILGRTATNACDIYSVGVLMFEMLTGSLPFDCESPEKYMEHQVTATTPDPRDVAPHLGIPTGLAEAVVRCLSKCPEDRFQDAESLIAVINASLAMWSSAPTPSVRPTEPPLIDLHAHSLSLGLIAETQPPESGLARRISWSGDLLAAKESSVSWGARGTGRSWVQAQACDSASA